MDPHVPTSCTHSYIILVAPEMNLKSRVNMREGNGSAESYFRGRRTMTEVPVRGSDVITISPW